MAFTRDFVIFDDTISTATGTVLTDWVRLPLAGVQEAMLTLETSGVTVAGLGSGITVTVQTTQDPDGPTSTTTGTSTLLTPVHAFTAISATTPQHLEALVASWSGSIDTLRRWVRLSIAVVTTGTQGGTLTCRLWTHDRDN